MVLSKILSVLQRSAGYHIDEVVSMHIDYSNRPESAKERDYIEHWCKLVGSTCKVRVITEATRGVTDRDEYEKVTRTIRYGFYESCIAEALGDGKVSGVMFGHHQGDVQENVISNVMR
jgi:tRNA(Ile)-lysidine synthase TilS/MesJ